MFVFTEQIYGTNLESIFLSINTLKDEKSFSFQQTQKKNSRSKSFDNPLVVSFNQYFRV
jgi:hypothetical protein